MSWSTSSSAEAAAAAAASATVVILALQYRADVVVLANRCSNGKF
jgi:hypothetical protein